MRSAFRWLCWSSDADCSVRHDQEASSPAFDVLRLEQNSSSMEQRWIGGGPNSHAVGPGGRVTRQTDLTPRNHSGIIPL
jgi:hypothetical protein